MNEIKTKSWYSDIEVSYKFDKDADIIKMTDVFVKILKEMWYWENNIRDLFSEDVETRIFNQTK